MSGTDEGVLVIHARSRTPIIIAYYITHTALTIHVKCSTAGFNCTDLSNLGAKHEKMAMKKSNMAK